MNYRTPLLTAAAAAAVVSLASAQAGPNDYNYNWANMNFGTSFAGGAGFTTGPVLFGAITASGPGVNFAGQGDSVRVCYGIDSTQGGRNQGGNSEVTWFEIFQGYSASNTVQLVDVGIVSIQAQSVDSLDGDACFSPFFAQGNDTGTGNPVTLRSSVSFAAIIGLIGGTTLPAGTFWDVVFEFIGSTGVLTPTKLGTHSIGGFANPLLTHLIYEVQGPLNGGPLNNQYYLASTSEALGVGDSAGNFTGGVTNGNGRQATSLFGVDAFQTGAFSHNRLTGYTVGTGLAGTTTVTFNGPETDMWVGSVAFRTPVLWAGKQAAQGVNTGGGGPDWVVSTAPPSSVILRSIDQLAGGQGNPLATASVGYGVLAANRPVFVYSATPAAGMLQKPLSWDDLGGAVPAQPGSIVLGPQFTIRQGFQTIPANFDAVTVAFLNIAPLTIGKDYTAALDPGVDGSTVGLFQNGQDITGQGMATWNVAGPVPAAASPNPGNLGIEIGVGAVGIQFNLTSFTLGLTEVYSSLEVILQ